ncbi:MAG: sulfotransferase [Bacteroidales bacterium]|nr:sulfotransferase [Bacteroidales bacterium]
MDNIKLKKNSLPGPIIVGGIGGSGTRILAEILKQLNYFMGNDLNESLDNLAYTLLFKRKKWFYKNSNNRLALSRGLGILEKSMTRYGYFSFPDLIFLLRATISMSMHGQNKQRDGTGKWPLKRILKIIHSSGTNLRQYRGWGWKEPNSHLLLPVMIDFFPQMKYIHLMRHGLDMAYSNNQQQLYNWGPLYDIALPKTNKDIPEASFRYWSSVHTNLLHIIESKGSEKILILNYNKMCLEPRTEITKLLTFLGINQNEADIDMLVKIPAINTSTGRYKTKTINWITKDDILLLQQLGFE